MWLILFVVADAAQTGDDFCPICYVEDLRRLLICIVFGCLAHTHTHSFETVLLLLNSSVDTYFITNVFVAKYASNSIIT